ncbi:2-amino-4-hydroxy-6-hydroxymethyldihydropteridine diphosphokinase [Neoactinobaculum massilliense]|uniref:2-amino-4-hydroxy-6- hydroxymethyldihydropteridine diphosphokinase n=1 Tax=Neoactinobaculum massilliense TaxID=2364794 RepID=UPI000F529AAD|nr:2-amino-4-hydroxy-6-hydroxymethyldihydropteridine diphosphokinase [Neoactinobaculum massilliense]
MACFDRTELDRITVRGVRAAASHGVHPQEKHETHPFVADVTALTDTRLAAATDALSATVSYSDVARDARAVLAERPRNLIETLAEEIATRVLRRGALGVEVSVHKPEAPLGLPFDDVVVHIKRWSPLLEAGTIRRVVVGLGANLGDAPGALAWATRQIAALDVAVTGVSHLYRSAPVLAPGQAPQPDYANAVLTLETALAPLDLLAELGAIEVRGGRVRREHWGARLLDLDIEDVEGVTSDFRRLVLPHPRASERLFVLEPWAELEPGAVVGGVPIAERIAALRADGEQRIERVGVLDVADTVRTATGAPTVNGGAR